MILSLMEAICFSSNAFYLLHLHQNVQQVKKAQSEDTRQTAHIASDIAASRNAPERQRRAASGFGRNQAKYDPMHSTPLVSPVASQQSIKEWKSERREGNKEQTLKILSCSRRHGPLLSFWKNSFLKQSCPVHDTVREGKTAREHKKAAEAVMENPHSVTEQPSCNTH